MKNVISENKIFLALVACWLIAGAGIQLLIPKGSEILWINDMHSPRLDAFFRWIYTCFGFNTSPPLFIALLIFVVFWSYGRALQAFINSYIVLLGIDFMHKFVTTSELNSRPSVFFGLQRLHTLPDIFLNGQSGYPAAAPAGTFALLLFVLIHIADKRWSYIFFAIALLYSISRLYVFQNFFDAVYAGSVIGVGSTLLVSPMLDSKYYQNIKWKDRSLYSDIRKLISKLIKS
ncbi:MAG: hypothetical protein JSS76_19440 [Bacteroidetes bacterium]|nr:hypothetical protein [Bacteroidota bacterium]